MKREDGHYRLFYTRDEFKRLAGFRYEDYRADLDPALTPIADEYLTIHRPLLAGAGCCDLVFRPSIGKAPPDYTRPIGEYTILTNRTRRFLPMLAPRGFSSHAFRHIIATHLVKNYDDGVRRAAIALHNTEETIRTSYQHLISEDLTRAAHKAISEELARADRKLRGEREDNSPC